jgi:tRNA/rRNA methyltransferase
MNCRVVLVRPEIAANLGATARVMRNMGLSELVLVAPRADPGDERARLLATHSQDILDDCRIVDDLGAAVADCVVVAGTSALAGGLIRRQSAGSPREVMPRLVEAMPAGPTALVFGPESQGLSNAEVTRCHHLIHIPTAPEHRALNLAQAVAVCLYELRQAWLAAPEQPAPAPRATFAQQEQMFSKLQEALEQIHFLYGEKAEALMHGIRHLIGRAGPSPTEVKILLGLARQIRWFAQNGGRQPD